MTSSLTIHPHDLQAMSTWKHIPNKSCTATLMKQVIFFFIWTKHKTLNSSNVLTLIGFYTDFKCTGGGFGPTKIDGFWCGLDLSLASSYRWPGELRGLTLRPDGPGDPPPGLWAPLMVYSWKHNKVQNSLHMQAGQLVKYESSITYGLKMMIRMLKIHNVLNNL